MASLKPILLIKITFIMILTAFVLYQLAFLNNGNLVYGTPHNASLQDYNFAAAGDWGCNPASNDTVTNMVDKDPELVLGLGDYSYEAKADCWLRLVDPLYHKMKIAIGNHDYQVYITNTTTIPSPSLLQQYMNHFNLSKQYYSFDYQNVHFVAMSTEVPFELGSDQYRFIQSDLEEAASSPNIDWIIVFYHRLAYSSPALLDSIPKIRNTYHPLFEKYDVDLVMQGHSHNYQRSFPIMYNNRTTAGPIITDYNKTNYINPSGQIFATVGTGGAPDIHRFSGPQTRFTAVQFNAFGFLNIDVLHNGTMLEGKFYENNGTIKDHFTIVKSNKGNEKTDSSSSLSSEPRLNNEHDDKFRIESVLKGFRSPTDMTFLGPRDVLVLEKDNGTVQRVVNGKMLGEPLLDVNVSNKVERGLLGIAISKADNGTTYVFLYYTEGKKDGTDICPKPTYCIPGTEPIGNRLYRYELTNDGTRLINPRLLLDLPATPGPAHNGGKMILGPNENIFIIIGDVMGKNSRTQNYVDGTKPDGTGGILRVEQEGNSSDEGPFGGKYPLNIYYAYGIRNGFGLDFDPVTGNLWDTENGPEFGDEINLVKQGFNSGWKDMQGIWNHRGGKPLKGPLNLDQLEDFNGKGNYSDPEFTWKDIVGPTGLKFFHSDKMGIEYKDSLFVGDVHNGNIYHFNLNDDRTSLLLNGTLADRIADSPKELEKVTFGEGFSGITDLEVGPDGYLYILSIGEGAIYRIVPK
jgi:glucose/arabinose dehydrogenase/predicted MPP superfamily phosphohydrolase